MKAQTGKVDRHVESDSLEACAPEDLSGRTVATLMIEPSRGWIPLDFREIWQYRELFYFLTWRDIKVRYKQTALGAAWAVIQPFATMVVFTVFFGKLAKVPSDGIPYPVFCFCALLPWQLFAFALTQSSNSLVTEARLITKVYFPRLVVPLASVVAGLVDFGIAFVVLLGMMFYYGIVPTVNVMFLPLFILFAVMAALAVGLWLSALNVKFRDVRYAVPFLTQFWMFASPVAYSSSLLPEQWRWVYGLNPMAGVIEGFRWALLNRELSVEGLLGVSVAMVALLFMGGLYYFRKIERVFADIV
jgi:lipopolysaccharide transport system permease protein